MSTIRKAGAGLIATLLVLYTIAFIVDMSQRYASNLRTKTATEAHEQLSAAWLEDKDGKVISEMQDGDLLFTHEHFRKLQSCHASQTNEFVDRSTGRLFRGEYYITWYKQGDYSFSENVQMPVNIIPGNYMFRRKTITFCSNNQVYYTTNFELPITIKP
jgi:hypothetical protein